MMEYVTDCHALYWHLTDSPLLGKGAVAAFAAAAAGQAVIYVPAIVLAEFFYLNKKLPRPVDFQMIYHRLDAAPHFILLPMLPEEMLDLSLDGAVTEMHDRMIVGVARRRAATLITEDRQIVQSNAVPIVW